MKETKVTSKDVIEIYAEPGQHGLRISVDEMGSRCPLLPGMPR
jgi:hypothetical protein